MKKIFKYSFIVLAALVASTTAMNAQTGNEFVPDPELEPGQKVDGIEYKKTAKKLGANDYQIDIEAFVTGTTTKTTAHEPIDFIFVLDRSSSMKGEKNTNMLSGVKSALKLIGEDSSKNVVKDGKGNAQYNRVSIVSFAANSTTYTKVDVAFADIKQENYETAFYNNIYNSTLQNGTYAGEGMKLAYNQATAEHNNQAYKDRQLVVILFTDGAPGNTASWSDSESCPEANKVVTQKNNIATLYGKDKVKFYTIGVFGSNPTSKTNIDHYMNAASSNYPTATAAFESYSSGGRTRWRTVSLGDPAEELKYYKDVKNVSDLEQIFIDITKESINGGAAVELTGETTANVDVMSSNFRLPPNMEKANVELYVALPTGVSGTGDNTVYTFGERQSFPCEVKVLNKTTKKIETITLTKPNVDIDKENQQVIVTGFDYSQNYVSVVSSENTGSAPEFTGCKLIISFHVQISPENPGGASEVTNDIASGLYSKNKDGEWEQIVKFQQPTVKVPNIVVIKRGLHVGESAVFTVTDATGVSKDVFTVVTTCTQDGKDAYAFIKVQDPGRFTVTEQDWSWAYDLTKVVKDYAFKDDNVKDEEWHAKGYALTKTELDANPDRYQAIKPSTIGTEVKGKSITRNINDFTEDATTYYGAAGYESDNIKGTLFIFENTAKAGAPAHGESYKNNEFSGHKEPSKK